MRRLYAVVGILIFALVCGLVAAQQTVPLTMVLTPASVRAYQGEAVDYTYVIANEATDTSVPVRVELEYVADDGTQVLNVSTAELVIAGERSPQSMWRVVIPPGVDYVLGSLSVNGVGANSPIVGVDDETGWPKMELGIDRIDPGDTRTVRWQFEVGAVTIGPAPPAPPIM